MGLGRNEKIPPHSHRFPTVGIVRKVTLTINTTPTNITTMVSRLPFLRCGIYGSAQSDTGNLFQRGRPRALWLGLVSIIKKPHC
jgi:hypothetical protein